ncbi:hypothetical protein FA13DRAFT_1621598 [Coprinellus micaceus]|uniref:PD-(D/E)XK endonuclease-like domain-containing protein n=1 Tax=Coprinellus micaceus TaxID=71717 RepID=A0A4Y7TUZ5_COPMI|nr:hypothetical protein FA13DRAFT_1621598 [Coprinellus micaceus]
MAERHNSLSATNLAAYHHLNCDLYLHHVYHKHTQPTTPEGFDRSGDQLLVESQYQRGLNWEATLYSWLDQSDLLLKVPGLPLQADVLLENILADEREHFFIAGITYSPPQHRLQELFFRAGTEPVEFGTGKPDLVEIRRDGHGITWKVIDAKASKAVKARSTSHHVQIYFYTLCLEYLLDHPSFYSSGSAGIWLPPEEGFNLASPSLSDIKSIQMSLLSRSLDAFLFERLPRLLSVPREDVRWHFNPLCQGCKYNPECRVNAVSEGKLGSMPNVSIPDARVLQDMLSSSGRSGSDIEDLHRLVSEDLPKIEQKFPIVAKKGKRVLGIRRKKVSDKYSAQVSPILESARAGKVEVIPRRNFTCPASEDVAVVVSLVQDPASPKSQVEFFAISLFTSTPQVYSGTGDRLIPTLAIIIDTLASSDLTTQFYVWSSAEQVLLQSHLIQQALVNSDLNPMDVRLCIGALSQGASLLQTAFQPVLLSGALLSFLVKGRRLKADYQACLERMGLSTRGTVPELRARVDQELKKLQHLSQHVGHQHEFGQVPRIIVLKKELEGMLAFPIAGYWDLRECAECLVGEDVEKEKADVPTDEEVFAAFKNDGTARLLGLLTDRNAMVNIVLNAARRRVCQARQNLLVNGGKILTTDFMDMCRQDDLRKLFFMQQFEVLSKLNELWSSRMGACPDAPVLEYCGKTARGGEHTFAIVSGVVDVPATDRGMSFFEYLLAEDVSSETEIPVEAMFDDLAVSGVVIPPNRSTKLHWDSQHHRVKENVLLADLRNISSVNGKLVVNVQTYGTPTNQILVHGRHYRLSPRLVDFNTTKVLSSLFELDLRWGDRERNTYGLLDRSIELAGHRGVPFLQLIMDPKSFGRVPEAKELLVTEDNTQRVFRNLKNLDVAAAASLLLKSSQHRATQRLLANRLAVIWGPPG